MLAVASGDGSRGELFMLVVGVRLFNEVASIGRWNRVTEEPLL